MNFGDTVLIDDHPGVNLFIAFLDSAGNYQWARQVGGISSLDQGGYNLLCDTGNNIYIQGIVHGARFFLMISCFTEVPPSLQKCPLQQSVFNQWVKGNSIYFQIPRMAGFISQICLKMNVLLSD